MNTGGEAAEQIVRMSLEGVEVAARISGEGAKNIAVLLYSILKEEQKTKGKARLTSMLRSGKELKVFTVKNEDLKRFTQEAKKYGVLYCVLADRKNKDPMAEVDIIARAEDAPKINRIVERFHLASVDGPAVTTEVTREKDEPQVEPVENESLKSEKDALMEALFTETPQEKEVRTREADHKDELMNILLDGQDIANGKAEYPTPARTEKSPLFEPILERPSDIGGVKTKEEKPSVKKEIKKIKESRKADTKKDSKSPAEKSTTKETSTRSKTKPKEKAIQKGR